MKPSFAANDLEMYYKHLKQASNYFEFGSGGSTYQASILSNIKLIISIESDKVWHNLLTSKVKHNNYHPKLIDLKCEPNKWGYPSNTCPLSEYPKYSEAILNQIQKNITQNLDLILIDGRFRVACALKSHGIINDNCKIIFDDFLDRKQYHVVLDYFTIIEKTSDNRMVVLKKKPNTTVPTQLIKIYEVIPG